jgi:hypothetical protein
MRKIREHRHLGGQVFGARDSGFVENAAKLRRHFEWARRIGDLTNNWAHLRQEVADTPGDALQRTRYEFGKEGQRPTRRLLSDLDGSACEFPQTLPEANRITQPVNALNPFVELPVRALSYLSNIAANSQASANCSVWHLSSSH